MASAATQTVSRGLPPAVCRREGQRSCDRQLRGLPFFDDLPEIRCQLAIVMSKHLIEGLLGPVRRLSNSLRIARL